MSAPHDNPNDPEGHELWGAFRRFIEKSPIELKRLQKDCEGCQRDWGHSYCGVCKGMGFLRTDKLDPEDATWRAFIAGAAAQFELCMIGYASNAADCGMPPSLPTTERREKER